MNKNEKVFNNKEFNLRSTINTLILIMVLSGFFGFIYETLFYKIDLGYFIKRGSSFGPWIPIYAFGGLFITLTTYQFRKKPLAVFTITCIVSGLLEYLTGFILYEMFNKRLWDYNIEIWNWGNINGYICARSILFFGISGLILIYIFIPLIQKFGKKVSQTKVTILSYTLGITFTLDILLYHISQLVFLYKE